MSGYITNELRRFYVYVSNRVEHIRRTSTPNQRHYVPTHLNPADLATQSIEASDLQTSTWHTGSKFLLKSDPSTASDKGNAAAEMLPDNPEEWPHVKVLPCSMKILRGLIFADFADGPRSAKISSHRIKNP